MRPTLRKSDKGAKWRRRESDFVHDRLVDGARVRILAVIDTLTRECPANAVEKSFNGKKVGLFSTNSVGMRLANVGKAYLSHG